MSRFNSDLQLSLYNTHWIEHDFRYFEGTDVECVLAPRAKYDKANTATGNLLTGEFVSSIYTHHQKTVICDAPDEESGGRRVVAFVGGLDITNGRYDTPEFPLFSTLKTLHKGDFLSNCVPGIIHSCPQMLHSSLQSWAGPLAFKILLQLQASVPIRIDIFSKNSVSCKRS